MIELKCAKCSLDLGELSPVHRWRCPVCEVMLCPKCALGAVREQNAQHEMLAIKLRLDALERCSDDQA